MSSNSLHIIHQNGHQDAPVQEPQTPPIRHASLDETPMGSPQSPWSPQSPQSPQSPSGRIKRPRNAFIIFRTEFAQNTALNDVEHENRFKSRSAAHYWNELMSQEEKDVYIQRAAQEKAEHKRKHPDYKLSLSPRVKAKRNNVRRNGEEDIQRSILVAELLRVGIEGDDLVSVVGRPAPRNGNALPNNLLETPYGQFAQGGGRHYLSEGYHVDLNENIMQDSYNTASISQSSYTTDHGYPSQYTAQNYPNAAHSAAVDLAIPSQDYQGYSEHYIQAREGSYRSNQHSQSQYLAQHYQHAVPGAPPHLALPPHDYQGYSDRYGQDAKGSHNLSGNTSKQESSARGNYGTNQYPPYY